MCVIAPLGELRVFNSPETRSFGSIGVPVLIVLVRTRLECLMAFAMLVVLVLDLGLPVVRFNVLRDIIENVY